MSFTAFPSDPPRNLTIFDGLDLINSNGPSVTVTLSGFLVPNAGFDAKLGAITYEGDDQLTGDSLSFNGVALSNALNPANNFFNGTRSLLGSAVSTSGDLPRLTGGPRSMSGMDLDVVDVTPRLTQGQTSATITASTNQDFYLLGGFVTSISTYKPDFGGATKTFTNVNAHPGGAVLPGDTIEYTISATNTGNDTATNVVLNDPLPVGLSFVPGSIRVTAGPNAGSKTDNVGDDQGEYVAASRTVRVRLGTGANGTTGGTMAINSTATVVFRVKVDATITGVIENQAVITARGQAGAPATDYVSDGNGGGPGAPPTPITVDGCAQNSDCTGATPYCLTTVTPHACVSCLTSTNCSGMTPTCEPASHTCRGCATDAECPSTAPVCQTSGACGECSAGNTTHCGGANPACNAATATCVACVDNTTCGGATPQCNVATHSCVGCLTGNDCAGSTPVCDPVFLTCRSCGSDSECGGATPACQPSGACGQCSALDSMACTGATPVCDTTTATCVRCTANADCSGTTPVCNTATHTCAGCSSDGQCGGATPGLPADRRLWAVLRGEHHGVHGRNAGLLHGHGDLRALHRKRRLQRDDAGLQWWHAHLRGLLERRAVRWKQAGLSAQRGLRAMFGGQPDRLHGNVSGLQCRDGHLPRLLGGRGLRRGDAGLPAERLVRRLLGRQQYPVHGRDPGVQHRDRDLRVLPHQRPVRRLHPDLQRCHPRLPRVHRRRRMWRATPACEPNGACGQCSATNAAACGGATPVCNTAAQTCVVCLTNAQCGGATPVCNTATHTCRGCAGHADCGGATPACQAGGACGQCSATNAAACGGATPVCNAASGTCVRCLANADCSGTTPVCNVATHTCTGCSTDGQCGGATPACQASGACGQCSATNTTACGGTTAVCSTANGTCVGCSDEHRLWRRRPGLQHGHPQLSCLRRGRRLRWGHAGLPAERGLRRLLGHQRQQVQRANGRLQRWYRRVRRLQRQRRLRRRHPCLQRGGPCLPGLRGRRRLRWRHAGLSAERRLRPVLGDERREVHRAHAGLRQRGGRLRRLRLERHLLGDDAGVQHGHPRLPRVRRRRRLRRRHPRL